MMALMQLESVWRLACVLYFGTVTTNWRPFFLIVDVVHGKMLCYIGECVLKKAELPVDTKKNLLKMRRFFFQNEKSA
jgi:hypothetical protein